MDTEKLVEEVRLLKSELNKLSDLIKNEKRKEKLFGEWIHEKEIMQLTGLSRSSLYSMYKQGKLIKSSISGKANYYKTSDFKKILDNNQFQ